MIHTAYGYERFPLLFALQDRYERVLYTYAWSCSECNASKFSSREFFPGRKHFRCVPAELFLFDSKRISFSILEVEKEKEID